VHEADGEARQRPAPEVREAAHERRAGRELAQLGVVRERAEVHDRGLLGGEGEGARAGGAERELQARGRALAHLHRVDGDRRGRALAIGGAREQDVEEAEVGEAGERGPAGDGLDAIEDQPLHAGLEGLRGEVERGPAIELGELGPRRIGGLGIGRHGVGERAEALERRPLGGAPPGGQRELQAPEREVLVEGGVTVERLRRDAPVPARLVEATQEIGANVGHGGLRAVR
jgi:hypothetical protein